MNLLFSKGAQNQIGTPSTAHQNPKHWILNRSGATSLDGDPVNSNYEQDTTITT